jgi:hypothetical protein
VDNEFTAAADGQYYIKPTDIITAIPHDINDPANPINGAYYTLWNADPLNTYRIDETNIPGNAIVIRLYNAAAANNPWTTYVVAALTPLEP